jgi:hypothetical protein
MGRKLAVLPTADLVDDELRLEPPTGGMAARFSHRAMTLATLEESLLQPAMRGLRRLPPGGRRLALNAILQSATDFPAFQAVTHLPGFARAADALLLDLTLGGVSAEELDRVATRVPDWLRERVSALARISRTYVHRLAERDLGDPALVLARACRALEHGAPLPVALRGFDEIRFRHIVDWPPGRVALVRALASGMRTHGGVVAVELPEPEGAPPEVRDALEPAYAALEASGADIRLERRPLRPEPITSLRAFTTATAAEECREIASRAAALVAAGTPVDEIAIAARGMRDLAAPLEGALAYHGIPSRSRHGPSCLETTLGRLALDLATWETPEECTRERVCALIACEAIDLRRLSDIRLTALEVVRQTRAAAIRSRASDRAGADGFTSRLERLSRSYSANGRAGDANKALQSAEILQRFFARVDDRPAHATLIQHAEALIHLLEDLGASAWLARTRSASSGTPASVRNRLDDRRDAALAAEQGTWERLCRSVQELEFATELLGIRERKLSRGVFAEWLKGALNVPGPHSRLTRGAGVELLELADLTGRRCRHVFLAGAYEGRLPEPPGAGDPLFTEEERWTLNQAFGRPVLRVSPSASTQSPLPSASLLDGAALALATEAAAESLTVSRPRMDDKERPLADSPLLPIVASPLAFEQLPYAPLSPALASRSSPSIDARRAIAAARASSFRTPEARNPWSGDVSTLAPAIELIAAGRAGLPWSASALEKLATCGFRYFAEWAWRAKEEDEPEDQAGPLEVGRVAHLAAEEAVNEMIKRGVWSPTNAAAAVRIGLEAAQRVLAAAEHSTVLGHPELWDLTREKMLRRLGALLRYELERTAAENVRPFGMELGFGLKDAALPPFEIAGVSVAGQIDRVDVGPGTVTILDYKSGRTDYNTKRFSEEKLFQVQIQLPLYVAAMRALLPQAQGKEIDAAYVSLRDTHRTTTLRKAMGGASLDTIQERLESAIRGIVTRVEEGQFPVTSRSCHGCHLQPVCRIPRLEEA